VARHFPEGIRKFPEGVRVNVGRGEDQMMKKNSFAHWRRETESSQRITDSAITHAVGDDVYFLGAGALSDEHQKTLEMLRCPDDICLVGRVVFDSTFGRPAVENGSPYETEVKCHLAGSDRRILERGVVPVDEDEGVLGLRIR
jgi:hypothetical protein